MTPIQAEGSVQFSSVRYRQDQKEEAGRILPAGLQNNGELGSTKGKRK